MCGSVKQLQCARQADGAHLLRIEQPLPLAIAASACLLLPPGRTSQAGPRVIYGEASEVVPGSPRTTADRTSSFVKVKGWGTDWTAGAPQSGQRCGGGTHECAAALGIRSWPEAPMTLADPLMH